MSTHMIILPFTSPRKALLAYPPSPWNLPFFTMESTLSSPCSRFDPLSLAKVRLSPTLTLSSFYDLVLWTDGSVPVSFGKGGPDVLANCSLHGTETTISFSTGPVCSSFSAEACAILQALCWSRRHQQVYHFSFLLLSDSRSVLTTLFSPPSFLLLQSLADLAGTVFCSIRLQWVPRHLFLPGNDATDELAKRGALVVPSTIPCSLSYPFFSFFGLGGLLSHLNSSTHRFPRFPPKNLH